ncbi:AbrB/MazE/SpoVT family DNA-binding domain-containing protein [Tunturibacter empetritectus]|uniref:Addiction module antidote n=1 Tax=Tunturiibacter lichenicola TaxID=2051959 RepID=A0A7W8J8R7_9BACT|nr:AbrB/MazE/SpoVT family DNA-binding domain-containing protein [Edaphobacter lichenicola]MBB5344680.1 putative addiction module antidote [Edaphobacter lichenicola]
MATAVKITTIGNSVGIVLPKEILSHLHVEKGDTLYVTESPDGIRLSPYDAALGRKLDAFEQVMRENRDVLKKLAE